MEKNFSRTKVYTYNPCWIDKVWARNRNPDYIDVMPGEKVRVEPRSEEHVYVVSILTGKRMLCRKESVKECPVGEPITVDGDSRILATTLPE